MARVDMHRTDSTDGLERRSYKLKPWTLTDFLRHKYGESPTTPPKGYSYQDGSTLRPEKMPPVEEREMLPLPRTVPMPEFPAPEWAEDHDHPMLKGDHRKRNRERYSRNRPPTWKYHDKPKRLELIEEAREKTWKRLYEAYMRGDIQTHNKLYRIHKRLTKAARKIMDEHRAWEIYLDRLFDKDNGTVRASNPLLKHENPLINPEEQ